MNIHELAAEILKTSDPGLHSPRGRAPARASPV